MRRSMTRGSRIRSVAVPVFLLAAVTSALACSGNGGAASAEVVPNTRPPASSSSQERPAPGSAWVIFGTDTVIAEVASTPSQREEGLMGRLEVPPGTGMLFVFPDSEIRSFWMKNTFVSLDIAFMNESFQVVDIKQMEAEDTTLVDSSAPSNFALEVMQGWLGDRGIEVGDEARVVFGPGLRVR